MAEKFVDETDSSQAKSGDPPMAVAKGSEEGTEEASGSGGSSYLVSF
jgi:hypothetical protein